MKAVGCCVLAVAAVVVTATAVPSAIIYQVDLSYEGDCSSPVLAVVGGVKETTCLATCTNESLHNRFCSDDPVADIKASFGNKTIVKTEQYKNKDCSGLVTTSFWLMDGSEHDADNGVSFEATAVDGGVELVINGSSKFSLTGKHDGCFPSGDGSMKVYTTGYGEGAAARIRQESVAKTTTTSIAAPRATFPSRGISLLAVGAGLAHYLR